MEGKEVILTPTTIDLADHKLLEEFLIPLKPTITLGTPTPPTRNYFYTLKLMSAISESATVRNMLVLL